MERSGTFIERSYKRSGTVNDYNAEQPGTSWNETFTVRSHQRFKNERNTVLKIMKPKSASAFFKKHNF
jgi:hypothetical protein